ncbi:MULTISPECIES: aminopeptidase [Solibacillus]|uniref:Aminopeptidase n=1 Tax=Solibacillus merdavium TaxID=2762218 RepID=A0ABR8XNF4_9BACL|nr:aminopeptidase [Solibacillus merdavium]MBD8033446.1 aminopeptidase [Solibacillus merdavium]
MSKDYIRMANEEDLTLITAYFKQALAHYEEVGELMAMQDIRYFLENMEHFQFFVLKETTEQITYLFEFPGSENDKRETGTLMIPLQNN